MEHSHLIYSRMDHPSRVTDKVESDGQTMAKYAQEYRNHENAKPVSQLSNTVRARPFVPYLNTAVGTNLNIAPGIIGSERRAREPATVTKVASAQNTSHPSMKDSDSGSADSSQNQVKQEDEEEEIVYRRGRDATTNTVIAAQTRTSPDLIVDELHGPDSNNSHHRSTAGNPNARSVKHLTCSFWYNGNCKWPEDVCLYAHRYTGQVAEAPRQVEPGRK